MTKSKVSLGGKVVVADTYTIGVEFGRTQAHMEFSNRGTVQRTLKLSPGDTVIVTIEKSQ